MMQISSQKYFSVLIIIFMMIILSACGVIAGSTPTPSPSPAPPTITPLPSPTPIPAVVVVNGERISVEEFEAELARLQSAQKEMGISSDLSSQQQLVLDELINQTLLTQGAKEAGFKVDDAMLQERLDDLATQKGGQASLEQWQTAHGYTPENFKQALQRQLAVAWMRDKIGTDLPAEIDQVHVIQILLYDEETAKAVLEQIKSGSDFATLAASYDPVTKGDLGWFPKGYLLVPEVEEAAFTFLKPGQVSEIIKSAVGFHIIQVVARDTKQPISPDVRLVLQRNAIQAWLENQRNQSRIEMLLSK
jgi:peptidyl-prolyl cis-trans isomerase C